MFSIELPMSISVLKIHMPFIYDNQQVSLNGDKVYYNLVNNVTYLSEKYLPVRMG